MKGRGGGVRWDGGGNGGYRGGGLMENLHAIVKCVSHDHASVAVDGDAAQRAVKLPVA